MKGLLDRLFGTAKAEVAPEPKASRERLQFHEFFERLITIDAIDFVGQCAKSPNGQFRLIWSDRGPEGTTGGYRTEGHGRWALLEHDRLICEGRLERPQDGKVANDGTFILNDWMFGERLNGRFVAFSRHSRDPGARHRRQLDEQWPVERRPVRHLPNRERAWQCG